MAERGLAISRPPCRRYRPPAALGRRALSSVVAGVGGELVRHIASLQDVDVVAETWVSVLTLSESGAASDLLDSEEQAAFRQLAVFSGRFDLEAVEHVVQLPAGADPVDALSSLVDKSMVVVDGAGEERF